ncbi:Gmad2 immunoglobulin-like domain-containing protein [Nocardioides gansuensis]|nr:Gmad2 immunoglobulin-like domain-containing protein [Nocardioides gansuensis]
MGLITDVRVRQPAKHDLVGRRFVVTGIGNGFEGTIGIRVLDARGRVLVTDFAQSSGGMAGIGEFSTRITVPDPPRDGSRLTLQVFGDNPGLPDEGPSPGFNLREVEIIMFADLQGWLLYRVEPGDTLSGIVRKVKDFGRVTARQIVAANPRIADPDHIEVGWRLRIPLRG